MMDYFSDIHFANPWVLYLLGLIPLLAIYYRWRYRKQFVPITMSGMQGVSGFRPTWRVRLMPLIPILRLLGLAALIVAIARPQSMFSEESITTEGIDIVVAMDVSTSMLAIDF